MLGDLSTIPLALDQINKVLAPNGIHYFTSLTLGTVIITETDWNSLTFHFNFANQEFPTFQNKNIVKELPKLLKASKLSKGISVSAHSILISSPLELHSVNSLLHTGNLSLDAISKAREAV